MSVIKYRHNKFLEQLFRVITVSRNVYDTERYHPLQDHMYVISVYMYETFLPVSTTTTMKSLDIRYVVIFFSNRVRHSKNLYMYICHASILVEVYIPQHPETLL